MEHDAPRLCPAVVKGQKAQRHMVATYLCNIVGINTNSINSINQVLQFKEGLHGYPLKTVYVFFVLRKAITKHISPIANPKTQC